MENKKGSVLTVFLVIAIILIVVMGALLYMQKTEADRQIAELENKIKETIQPVADLKEKIEEATNSQNDFIESISENSENTENMEKLINDEIKKAEMLKSEVEKIIKTTNNSIKNVNITNWWNGMGYDL